MSVEICEHCGSGAPDFGVWMGEAKKRIAEWGVAVPTNTKFYATMYLSEFGVQPVLPNEKLCREAGQKDV